MANRLRPPFHALPTGAVSPDGWILVQMRRDLEDGFAGCLDQLTPRVATDIFSERIASSTAQTSWWDAETRGNWLWGYLMMAHLAGHPRHIARSRKLVHALMDGQDPDGYIGVYDPDSRFRHPPGENGELWAQSRALLALLALYQLNGDSACLHAVERAVALTSRQYGPGRGYFTPGVIQPGVRSSITGLTHGLCYTDVLEALSALTGNEAPGRFGAWLYQDFSDLPRPFPNDDMALPHLLDPERPLSGHAVHTAEHWRAVLWACTLPGGEAPAAAAWNALDKLRRYTLPSGALLGDESLRDGPAPDIGYEYCTLTELLCSLASAAQKTGDASIGDWMENLAFNAAQGARLADGKGVAYLSSDTRTAAEARRPDAYSPSRGSGRFKFSPTHEDVACCCNPNAVRFMPHFVSRMWMSLNEAPGLAALAFGPSRVRTLMRGVPVAVGEDTGYPFADEITFRIQPEQPVQFSLLIRKPGWATEPRLTAKGGEIREESGWYRVDKSWRSGDTVTLHLPAAVRTSTYSAGEVAVHRGPLQYVLPIPMRWVSTKDYPVAGFHDYDILPAEKIPVARLNPANSELGLRAQRNHGADLRHPWDAPPLILTDGRITLVPMGCAPLRHAAFPP